MAANSNIFAIFKNGTEVPNSRFEATDPAIEWETFYAANIGVSKPTLSFFTQLQGQATLSLTAGDYIELRCITPSKPGVKIQSGDGVSNSASLNIEKVSL